MSRYRLGLTPYAGVLYQGPVLNIVDEKPTRDIGWDQPLSGHVVLEPIWASAAVVTVLRLLGATIR